MSLARYLASLLNSSGQVANAKISDLAAAKVTGTLSDSQIAAMAASKLTGQVPDANAPSGSVIQVVQTVKTNTFFSSSTSYVDITGFAATITPMLASSKILININLNVGIASDTYHAYFRLNRNGVLVPNSIGTGGQAQPCMIHKNGNNYRDMDCAVMSFLDSPNSTSAQTYQVTTSAQTSSSGTLINYCQLSDGWTPSGISTLTLYEIAA